MSQAATELSRLVNSMRKSKRNEVFGLSEVEQLIETLDETIKDSNESFGLSISDLTKIHKYLLISFKNNKESFENNRNDMLISIDEMLNRIDTKLSSLVSEYTGILEEEMKYTGYQLAAGKETVSIVHQEAKLFRDVKIFGQHLSYLTQGKVTINFLESSTVQFAKCEKAFNENIHPSLKRTGFQANAFGIVQINNGYLSREIQNAIDSNSGRVKGVFCLIPFDFAFHFAAYGLYLQEFQHCLPKKCQNISNWYTHPWLEDVNSDYKFSPVNLLNEIKRNPSPGAVKFSNCSTPDTMRLLDDLARDGIACIALCRVLINKVIGTSSEITDDDIAMGRAENNDVIYCSNRAEYVFMNPEHVLPEFLIYFRTRVDGAGIIVLDDPKTSTTKAKDKPIDTHARKQAVIGEIHDILKSSINSMADILTTQTHNLEKDSKK